MKKKHISYNRAVNKAMYLCSKAEKCKSDIRKKLYDWKSNPEDHTGIIEELEKNRYIDEKRYAEYYVRDKFKFNKWGRIKIRAMLYQKQIPEKLINDALEQIDDKSYIEMLKNVIDQKKKSLKEDDLNKKKTKLIQFASSKGFEPGLIFKVLEI